MKGYGILGGIYTSAPSFWKRPFGFRIQGLDFRVQGLSGLGISTVVLRYYVVADFELEGLGFGVQVFWILYLWFGTGTRILWLGCKMFGPGQGLGFGVNKSVRFSPVLFCTLGVGYIYQMYNIELVQETGGCH